MGKHSDTKAKKKLSSLNELLNQFKKKINEPTVELEK
jgi:hypothetical protein